MKNNLDLERPVVATQRLVRELGVKVTNHAISKTVRQHQDFPSLLSISDSLKSWNVNNIVARTSVEQLEYYQPPFLACVYNDHSVDFAVVTSVRKSQIDFYEKDLKKSLPLDQFVSKMIGVVLVPERSKNSGQKNYHQEKAKELVSNFKVPLIGILLLLLSSLHFLYNTSSFPLAFYLIFFLKVLGLTLSTILLSYELGSDNFKSFCKVSSKFNCKAVVSSNEAKLLKIFTWSEVGLVYFLGSILVSALLGNNSLVFLYPINIAAITFVPYSIYMQRSVLRKWCLLCLVVQSILILEFIIYVTSTKLQFPALIELGLVAGSYILAALSWYSLKPTLVEIVRNSTDHFTLQRLKTNKELFNTLLSVQSQLNHPPDSLGIVLGNPNSKNNLITISNPYCKPCAKSWSQLMEVLRMCPDLRVNIIFLDATDDPNEGGKMINCFLAIRNRYKSDIVLEALEFWYGQEKKSYEVFSKLYSIDEDLEKYESERKNMRSWCIEQNIKGTPTYYLNNYQVPNIYSINEIYKFIDN